MCILRKHYYDQCLGRGLERVFAVERVTIPRCGFVQTIYCDKAYKCGERRCREQLKHEYEDHEEENCDKHGEEWRQKAIKALGAELERLISAAPREEVGAETKQLKVATPGKEGIEDSPQESEHGGSWFSKWFTA